MSALRPYQQEAHDAVHAAWRAGTARPGVSLPTGTGKTHVMAHLARTEVTGAQAPGQGGAVLFLVHRDTLVEQTLAKLRVTLPPTTSVGVVKGPRNEVGAQVIVASVHSLRRADRRRTLPPVRACVVDEAHVSVSPTYRAVYEHLGRTRYAGFSATWTRSDSTGLGDCWDEVVFARSIKWAVRSGYLVPAVGVQVGEGVDASAARVSRSTGDYREDDLEALVMLESLRDLVVRAALERDRHRPTALFAPTVASAEYFGDALRAAGVRCSGFYGHTGPTERRRVDAGLRDGSVEVVTTCTAIAEGYDNPQLSRCLLVRPTRHEGLFVQVVGRFLRPWPGKADALVLDLVGATDDVQLRNAVDLSTTEPTLQVDPEPGDEDLLDEEEHQPVERMVRRVRHTREVDLYAGTSVKWNVGPGGVPFVECGETLVFLLEGRDGWYVGEAESRMTNGRPLGRWVAQGLAQDDALTVASDYAEEQGGALARRSSSWRRQAPSEAQLAFARRVGVPEPEGLTRGQLSDELSRVTTSRVLGYFRAWADRQREAAS